MLTNAKLEKEKSMLKSNATRVIVLITLFLAFGAYPEAAAPTGPTGSAAAQPGKPTNFAPPTSINPNGSAGAAVGATTPIPGAATPGAPQEIKPYRTFITLQRYTMENNGEPSNPISNVRIDVTFPNKSKLPMPDANQFWPIGNGQVQEINRTFEVPWAYIQGDGFKFEIQMVRKGTSFLPCQFDVTQLSQFNRSYVCHTDLNWQTSQNLPQDKLDKEGIQVRVFTDKNADPKEIPNDAIALK